MKRVVADIPKNQRETIRVELDEYEGNQLVATRVWYSDDGELKPTRKGLSIAIKHLPAIRAALEQAEKVARAEGLLQ
jgi:hypothetical protein